jgi:hypothetical protein
MAILVIIIMPAGMSSAPLPRSLAVHPAVPLKRPILPTPPVLTTLWVPSPHGRS